MFYARHEDLLRQAVRAVDGDEYFSPFTKAPTVAAYGRRAARRGESAFLSLLGDDFPLDQPADHGTAVTESSAYGIDLGIGYPSCEPGRLIGAATRAMAGWRAAGAHERAGVAAEILHRLSERSFEMAHAVHHTTGVAFATAHQSGGPHAQDRGLEAVARALAESTRRPSAIRCEKPHARGGPLLTQGTSTVAPRGISLLVACRTFPTWNTYPALFASLVTGNPVIVAPHPGAVLPLAITVQVARQVLDEAGYDPNAVTLAVARPGGGQALVRRLATDPAVRIVDHTDSSRPETADWLEHHARQAVVFRNTAGLNTVVVDSTDDYAGLLRDLAIALSLCSGQLRTTPRNILVPAGGIGTDKGRKAFGDFCTDLSHALDRLLSTPRRAAGILGALVDDGVRERLADAERRGVMVHPSKPVRDPDHPDADVRTPLVVRVGAGDERLYTRDWSGPVSCVVATGSTAHSLEIFRRTVRRHGAVFGTVHSTDPLVLAAAEVAALDAGVHLSQNRAGSVFTDQIAVFSDFHGTGADPAVYAAPTDPAFVTGRFLVLQSRRHVVETAGNAALAVV
ncbi:phenylacetic acid degradation protein PaaN [Streptomyces sp. NBC_01537]|uniref:phenylacetic acid degradation protein PaaN n=1 Tax=Streptomyces sp. NBC_01537 TaxID=2903896 RepID=UPI003869DCA4